MRRGIVYERLPRNVPMIHETCLLMSLAPVVSVWRASVVHVFRSCVAVGECPSYRLICRVKLSLELPIFRVTDFSGKPGKVGEF